MFYVYWYGLVNKLDKDALALIWDCILPVLPVRYPNTVGVTPNAAIPAIALRSLVLPV